MKKRLSIFSKKFYFFGIVLSLMSFQQSFAQQTITGTIIDTDNLPLPGAGVVIKGTTNGTATDFDGNYEIAASKGDVLEFSFQGYETKTVTVGDQTTINITLAAGADLLDEVVVIGYGTARKSDVVSSISNVATESFKEQPITRAGEALQGRASGVQVRKTGRPGEAFRIRIRGVSSITGGNDPLVVIDGVLGGDIRTINPSDIKSMEVLKDASALAIYGSRGANGVILITTKKGSGKAKVVVDYSYKYSELQQKIDDISGSYFGAYVNATGGKNPKYTVDEIRSFGEHATMQDELFRSGFTHNAQVSLSGSGADNKVKYFISGNYVDQDGIMINTGYKRTVLRSNTSVDVSDKFNVSLNLTGNNERFENDPDALINRFSGSAIQRAMAWDPTAPLFDENGDYVYFSPSGEFGVQGAMNPIAVLNRSRQQIEFNVFSLASNLKYDFTDNFSYTATIGYTFAQTNSDTMRRSQLEVSSFSNSYNTTYRNNLQVSNIFNYNTEFGNEDKHRIDLTGVYEYTDGVGYFHGYAVNGFEADNIYFADNAPAADQSFSNNGGRTAIESYLARATYSFDNSLNLSASFRADGSSNFDEDNRWGYFPSVGAGYSFNNMAFVEESNVLNNFKIRAGYGQVGNQAINANARLTTDTQSQFQYSFDGTLDGTQNAVYISQLGNNDLTWETTTQINVGFDLGFFNNRLTTSIDLYQKETEDLLLRYTVPNTNNLIFNDNVGAVENKGIDITINGDIISKEEFRWNAGFTGSYLQNEITELPEGVPFIEGQISPAGANGEPLNWYSLGGSLGDFYGFEYLGTWKSTDPEVLAGEQTAGRERLAEGDPKTIGNALPDFTWGLNNTFDYKNWTFNLMVTGSHGNDVYNMVKAFSDSQLQSYIAAGATEPAWTPTNETNVPALRTSVDPRTTRYIEDGSFIRVNNLSAAYTFTTIKGIESLKVYASGENLFLFSGYEGYDPEVSSNALNSANGNADASTGIDAGAYPNPRSFTLGFTLGF